MCFRTFGRVIAHKNVDELNRAEGPAVHTAQPEGLGFWFRHRGEGQRPGSLVCETTSEIPCDLQTAGPFALYHKSSFVSQTLRLGQVNGWGFAQCREEFSFV